MNQQDLNRAVAAATGEGVATIKRLGFSLVAPPKTQAVADDRLGPRIFDWDVLGARHMSESIWSPR